MRVLNDWFLTAERVAVHLPSRTVVVADPHLGYAEARRRAGECVPDDTLEEQLADLDRVLRQHDARQLVVAGDLLEHRSCRTALSAFYDWLRNSKIDQAAIVLGNHDRGQSECGLSLNPPSANFSPRWIVAESFEVGGWRIVHGDATLPDGPVVQGHEHPYLRWTPPSRVLRPCVFGGRIAAGTIEGACYLLGPQRLILPAFSREAAGVNVLNARRWGKYRCCVVAGPSVLDLGEVAGLGPRLAEARRRSRLRGGAARNRERRAD